MPKYDVEEFPDPRFCQRGVKKALKAKPQRITCSETIFGAS